MITAKTSSQKKAPTNKKMAIQATKKDIIAEIMRSADDVIEPEEEEKE